MLSIDGINYEKKSAQYKAQISNAKKNGTRCFMLFIEKNAWKLLPLIKKEKDLKRSVKRRRAGPCGPA